MAEEAVGPDVIELMGCGLAVERPVAGSAFPGGHRTRVGFFRFAQFTASTGGWTAPLVETDVAETVDVDDVEEAIDELEFCRWTVLRGPVLLNILVMSSVVFRTPKVLPLELHRALDWKEDNGDATAVIGGSGS